jgi:hypothetical protein
MAIAAGVGLSGKYDSYQAGKEAAILAFQNLRRREADLVIAFASTKFDQERLLDGITSETFKAPLVGCSAAGEITNLRQETYSVVVMAIKSDNLACSTGLGVGLKDDARSAGHKAARQALLNFPSAEKHLLVIFPDGLGGNAQNLIRGAQEVLGTSFPIVGGSASDEFCFKKTYQYLNRCVLSDSVSALLIGGDISIGIGARHGWKPLGRPRKVTRASANILSKVDGKAAISVYEEYFDSSIQSLQDGPLARMTIMYPLGIWMPGEEEYLVRNALWAQEDGSLVCAGEIPQDSEIRLMMATKESALDAAEAAAREALLGLRGASPKLALVFDSISRSRLLGTDSHKEVEVVSQVLGKDVPLAGFYTFGEQAPLKSTLYVGRSYFHNEAIVVVVIGE